MSLHANITETFPQKHILEHPIIVLLIRVNTLSALHPMLKKTRQDWTESTANISS